MSLYLSACRSFEWKCPNKECVTLAYRCDDFNDCGSDESGADEDGCGGLSLGKIRHRSVLIGGDRIISVIIRGFP